jgi:L-amino acid N-acyltransferase YncA
MSDALDLRPLSAADFPATQAFFDRLPEGDVTFFKEDISDPAMLARWTAETRNRRLVAVSGGDVVGYVAVIPLVGWSDHVGELRLVIDPTRRRQGIGRTLARAGLVQAIELGLQKIIVEVVADQAATIQLFDSLGFEGEALLKDHVRDRDGNLRDLILLAHPVQENWELMAASGLDDAFAPDEAVAAG